LVTAESSGRELLSWLWTPLVAVTAAFDGDRSGQVAVSVHGASIVPSRPRLTVALWKDNFTHDLALRSGAFAVHILRDDQDELVYHFGLQSGREVDKLASCEHEAGITGSPLLADCLAVFECRVVNHMDGGDHTQFLADVIASSRRSEGSPLWWRDLRPRMPADKRAIWDAKSAASMRAAEQMMDRITPSPSGRELG
jgi:flavin reductase (DIM6/NTAB) family NADH-FMN oxidoreductase RutF